MKQLYALHDSNEDLKKRGAFPVTQDIAKKLNLDGYGIFWTVNDFNGPRKKENLLKINAWAIDVDEGTKLEMIKSIEDGLVPSLVVESFRGFHVYWFAQDATEKNWNAIVWDRLVPFYGADKNAKDICRILRATGFKHMKNPDEPFEIKTVFQHPVFYTEEQMFHNYCPPEVKNVETSKWKLHMAFPDGGKLFDRIYNIDCHGALERLSGHPSVGGEVFTFKRHRNSTSQILVNGKSTSCWVDRFNRIGSSDGGGPTIWQWINWYQHDHKKTYRIIKEILPELARNG